MIAPSGGRQGETPAQRFEEDGMPMKLFAAT